MIGTIITITLVTFFVAVFTYVYFDIKKDLKYSSAHFVYKQNIGLEEYKYVNRWDFNTLYKKYKDDIYYKGSNKDFWFELLKCYESVGNYIQNINPSSPNSDIKYVLNWARDCKNNSIDKDTLVNFDFNFKDVDFLNLPSELKDELTNLRFSHHTFRKIKDIDDYDTHRLVYQILIDDEAIDYMAEYLKEKRNNKINKL